jgi:hypothetical protein
VVSGISGKWGFGNLQGHGVPALELNELIRQQVPGCTDVRYVHSSQETLYRFQTRFTGLRTPDLGQGDRGAIKKGHRTAVLGNVGVTYMRCWDYLLLSHGKLSQRQSGLEPEH